MCGVFNSFQSLARGARSLLLNRGVLLEQGRILIDLSLVPNNALLDGLPAGF